MMALTDRTRSRVLTRFYVIVLLTLALSHTLIALQYNTGFTIVASICLGTIVWLTLFSSRYDDPELLRLIQTFSGIAALLLAGLGYPCVLLEVAMATSAVIWSEAFVLALLSILAPYYCKSVSKRLLQINPTGAAVSVIWLSTVYSFGASTVSVMLASIPFIAAIGFMAIRAKLGVQ
jgi:hypothetical protein